MKKPIDPNNVDAKTVVMSLVLAALMIYVWATYFGPLDHDVPVQHTVEATAIRTELRVNELAAHHKYGGKMIEVFGAAHTASMSGKTPVISLGVLFTNVDCHLDAKMTEPASRLKKGTHIRVRGKAHTVGSDVFLKPCVLL